MKVFLKIILSLLPLFLLSLFSSSPVLAQDIFWSTPAKISQSLNYALAPVITSDSKGYVHSVWMETPTDQGFWWDPSLLPTPGIFYSYWNGDTWSTPQKINNPAIGLAEWPSITATPNNNVHVVWDEGNASLGQAWNGQIYYSRYNGSSWTPPVSISSSLNNPTNNSMASFAKIASDSSGNLYVIFSYNTSIGGQTQRVFYYTRSTDNGVTWSAPSLISQTQTLTRVYFSDVAVDSSGNVHVLLWNNADNNSPQGVYYTYYNGSTWSGIQQISGNTGKFPRLVIDGGNNLHAAWITQAYQGAEVDLVYDRKPSGGSWAAPYVVSTTVADPYWYSPLIGLTVDNNNNAYVGWGQFNGTYYADIGSNGVNAMYRQYNPSTSTWSNPNLVRSTKYLDAPLIWRDKWWNQHFVWSEMNPTSNQWETWYSEIPANVGSYNPASKLTITMAATTGSDTLALPSGALATTATISAQVGPLPASANSALTTIPRSYTFRPSGTTFISGNPATATINYTTNELIGTDERNLKVYVWDSTLNSWSTSYATSVNTGPKKITVTLPHFSLYGVFAPKISTQFQSPLTTFSGTSIPLNYQLTNLFTGQPADAPVQRTILVLNDDNTTSTTTVWDSYTAQLTDNQGNLLQTLDYNQGQGNLSYDTISNTYNGSFSAINLPEGNYTVNVYLAGNPVGGKTFHFTPPSVSFLPPLTNDTLYSMNDGSTLPFKFALYAGTSLLTTNQNVSVIITSTDNGNTFRQVLTPSFDPTTGQYLALLKTKDLNMGLGNYQGQVVSNPPGVLLQNNTIGFSLLDSGTAKGIKK